MKSNRLLSNLTPFITCLGFVFLFAPLVILVIYSFNSGSSTVVWSGFGFSAYSDVLHDERLKSGISVSAIVAICSATLATLIGGLGALAVVKRDFKGKTLFSTTLIAPLVLPEIVLAVGILISSIWAGVTLGYTTLVAGHVLISIPYSFLIIRASAAGFDHTLDEAAADLGADGWQTFRRVTMPLLLPAVLSAFLLCAVISFDNFVISTFVSGVGTTPLPIEIYASLKTGLSPKVNALGTMLIVVNVLVISVCMKRFLNTQVNK